MCAALAAIASSDALHESLLGVLIAARDIIADHPVVGAGLFVIFAAVSAMFTFVSIAVIVPAMVFACGVAASAAFLWLGWILGGVAAYSVGRFLGRRVVTRITGGNVLERLESHLPPDAPMWWVLLLQLALPSEIPGYLLGLARYRFTRYIVALGLAELPYALVAVYLGDSFVEQRTVAILIVGALIAALSLGTLYLLRRSQVLREYAALRNPPSRQSHDIPPFAS